MPAILPPARSGVGHFGHFGHFPRVTPPFAVSQPGTRVYNLAMQSPVAIILAGGANRRFWPLQQKSLLRFGDQTLLDRHVGALAAAGFADVVVVANPANDAYMRALAYDAPTRIHVVVQPEPLGMGDAFLQ